MWICRTELDVSLTAGNSDELRLTHIEGSGRDTKEPKILEGECRIIAEPTGTSDQRGRSSRKRNNLYPPRR